MKDIALLILGVLISVIGIVNMTGNISTVHSYNRRRVSEEDAPKYGKFVGSGTLTVGLACIANFALTLAGFETAVPYVTVPSLAVGLGLILFAQFKYNRGIF